MVEDVDSIDVLLRKSDSLLDKSGKLAASLRQRLTKYRELGEVYQGIERERSGLYAEIKADAGRLEELYRGFRIEESEPEPSVAPVSAEPTYEPPAAVPTEAPAEASAPPAEIPVEPAPAPAPEAQPAEQPSSAEPPAEGS